MGLFSVFKKGLQKTATTLSRGITSIFKDVKKWDDSTFVTLENLLLEADFGAEAAKKSRTISKIVMTEVFSPEKIIF